MLAQSIWNRLDGVGAAARATDRKVAEAEAPAAFSGADGAPYRIASCWLLVDTAANRRLVAAYPEILRTRFPGSSARWPGRSPRAPLHPLNRVSPGSIRAPGESPRCAAGEVAATTDPDLRTVPCGATDRAESRVLPRDQMTSKFDIMPMSSCSSLWQCMR